MTGGWGHYYYWNVSRSNAKTKALLFFYYRYFLMKNKLIGLDIRGQKVQLCKKLRIKFLLFSIIYIWLNSNPPVKHLPCSISLDIGWLEIPCLGWDGVFTTLILHIQFENLTELKVLNWLFETPSKKFNSFSRRNLICLIHPCFSAILLRKF